MPHTTSIVPYHFGSSLIQVQGDPLMLAAFVRCIPDALRGLSTALTVAAVPRCPDCAPSLQCAEARPCPDCQCLDGSRVCPKTPEVGYLTAGVSFCIGVAVGVALVVAIYRQLGERPRELNRNRLGDRPNVFAARLAGRNGERP